MKQELERICALNPENLGTATPQDFLFKYIDISSVEKGRIHWGQVSRYKFSEAPSRARRRVKKDDVLLCTVRPGLQAHARIPKEDGVPFVASTGFAALRPYNEEDSSFVFHQLFSKDIVAQLRSKEVGSSYPAVNESDVRQLSIFMPEPSQRKAIGKVLDTIDEAIAQTESVIAKLKQVRAGMLHDLLSYGLDENGQLRNPVAHPEQFKDSPLGRIPRAWDSGPLSQFVLSAEYGISTSLGDKGYPVLRMNNLSEGEAELSDLKYSAAPVPEGLWLRPGDVLFNRTNSWEHVGRTGIWRGQIERATFASYLVRLNPNPDRLISELLNLWLNWPVTQIAIRRFATPAVQQVNINPTNLRQVRAAFPISINEQTEIVERINRQDMTIRSARAEHIKLMHLKSGLQDDLLTGRVRVPETIMEGAENA